MKTSTTIYWGLMENTIGDDILESAFMDLQTFSTDVLGRTNSINTLATYEPDRWILDGSCRIADYGVDKISMLSLDQSDSDGTFPTNKFYT